MAEGSQAKGQEREATGALAAAVRVVSGFTLLSRFAGLARDVVTARIFGDDMLGSAFRAAYALPNFFRRLFGEGALSAAFLPEYTILKRDDPAMARQLASIVVWVLTLVTAGLTLLIEVGLFIRMMTLPTDAELALSIRLIMLMLPMMPAVCITAILGGMLQAHGRFGPPAAAPIILNLFQIAAGLLYFTPLMDGKETAAYVVGASAVAASAVQIAWSLAALRGKLRWTRAVGDANVHARRVLTRFLPGVLGLGTLQLNTMLDMVIAMWPIWVGATMFGRAVPLDDRSNAILSYTQTLYQFPLGVFGIAVATAVFPLLSRASDRPQEFMQHLRRGIRLSLFIGLPASAGLWLVRHDLVYVIFGGGGETGFTADGLARSALVLAGFAPAVWAYSLNQVLTRSFYARHDTVTPMKLAIATVGLNVVLNFTLIWPLGEAGLAWSTAISACLQAAALLMLARWKLGVRPFNAATTGATIRCVAASVAMSAAVWGAMWALPTAEDWRGHALRLGVSVIVGGIGYILAAMVLRMPELRWLFQRHKGGAGEGAAGMGVEG